MPGRTLAIGDIHGCDVALATLLDRLQPTTGDTVVVLGDVVDRGSGTRQAIDHLLRLRESCTLHFILGNHEEMMLEAFHSGKWMQDWLHFGGKETLASYGGNFDDLPTEHMDFLSSGLNFWETDTEIYVHARLEPNVPLKMQSGDWLRWAKLMGTEAPHPSGRRVICGHTAQPSGKPLVFEGWACIDTCVYGGGRLSCLDVAGGMIYQSTQSGEFFDAVPINSFTSNR